MVYSKGYARFLLTNIKSSSEKYCLVWWKWSTVKYSAKELKILLKNLNLSTNYKIMPLNVCLENEMHLNKCLKFEIILISCES